MTAPMTSREELQDALDEWARANLPTESAGCITSWSDWIAAFVCDGVFGDSQMHPLSDIRDLDEVVRELGIQDSSTTPAEAVRELNAEIERLRSVAQASSNPVEISQETVGKIVHKLHGERDQAIRESLELEKEVVRLRKEFQAPAWQPIETCPNDDGFHFYGLHVDHRNGSSWFEAHYLCWDDAGVLNLPSGDNFDDWAYSDFTHWAPAPSSVPSTMRGCGDPACGDPNCTYGQGGHASSTELASPENKDDLLKKPMCIFCGKRVFGPCASKAMAAGCELPPVTSKLRGGE